MNSLAIFFTAIAAFFSELSGHYVVVTPSSQVQKQAVVIASSTALPAQLYSEVISQKSIILQDANGGLISLPILSGDFNLKSVYLGNTIKYESASSSISHTLIFTGTTTVSGKLFISDFTGKPCFTINSSDLNKVPASWFCFLNPQDVKRLVKKEIPANQEIGLPLTVEILNFVQENKEVDGGNYTHLNKVIGEE